MTFASQLTALAGLMPPKMDQTLESRLREVMEAKGWTRADLVRVSKQSSSVVSQWLGHGTKQILTIGKMEAAERLEAESGFAALWIAKGIGPKRTEVRQIEPTPLLPTPAQTVRGLAALLNGIQDEATRQAVASGLDLLVKAPDSARVIAQLIDTLSGASSRKQGPAAR